MRIPEMHEMFRTLGQQMGMQTIRAILPEDIDTYLNNQIIDKVRSVVAENTTTVYNDKVTLQNNAISPLNAIKTLYKDYNVSSSTGDGSRLTPYASELSFDAEIMYYIGASIYYSKNKSFKCRLIEPQYLEDTLNDYCNRSTWDCPVAKFRYNDDAKMEVNVITEDSNRVPTTIVVKTIKLPKKVYLSIDGESDVDCDLPEQEQYDVVVKAVNEYFRSVGSTSQNPD